MKPLLLLLTAGLVTSSLFFRSHCISVQQKNRTGVAALYQSSLSHFRFTSANSRKTTDTCKTPPVALRDNNRVFEKAETEASIDITVWQAYLRKRLQPFFDSTAANIPVGSYRVDVRFVVEMDGRIWRATAISDPGYGLAKASEDAIWKGPRWKPGEINGGFVRSYHTQPITFMVTPDECDADTTKEAASVLPPHTITPGKCEAGTLITLMLFP